jgi:hypothetical protein
VRSLVSISGTLECNKEIALIISDDQKKILAECEAQLLEAGCPSVGRLLIQRGVGWLMTTAGISWNDEKAKILAFVDEAHVGSGE